LPYNFRYPSPTSLSKEFWQLSRERAGDIITLHPSPEIKRKLHENSATSLHCFDDGCILLEKLEKLFKVPKNTAQIWRVTPPDAYKYMEKDLYNPNAGSTAATTQARSCHPPVIITSCSGYTSKEHTSKHDSDADGEEHTVFITSEV
jgi:hypothetical protein